MGEGLINAIQITENGGPEVLQYTEVDAPEAGPGQLAVQVAAAGVNFIDIYHRQGVYPLPLPRVLGLEGAGRVIAVGDGVSAFQIGDRVAWLDVFGSYAQVAVDTPDKFILVPADVSYEQAAAVTLQGLTAHALATDVYRINPGDAVLIHAGAGGVGLLLTQIAKIKGARVITTVSTPAKAALSRSAGADEVVIGYDDFPSQARAFTDGAGVNVVYDGVGGATFDGSLESIRRRGLMVLFGGASGQVPPFDIQRLNQRGSLTLTRPKVYDFVADHVEMVGRAADVFGWIADGRLDVRIGGRFPLAQAAQAQEDLAARKTTGKLVLIP
jgi:NADPH2:quinone reductase